MPLDPEFDRRIRALVTAGQSGGKSLNFESVYRSPQDQARAINSVSMNVNKRPASIVDYARGIPGYAAPVGSSMHQKGLAADLAGGGVGWARDNAANYGIRFPESLRGTDPNHAEIDPKFWGPVQDPRDAAATAAAASAPPIKVAEIPASASQPAPSAARVASYSNSTGAAPAMAQSYSGWTPESTDFAKKFGAQQMKEGIDSSPVGHWTQAIARVLQAGSGAAWNQQGLEGERAGNARVSDIYAKGLANNDPVPKIAASLMGDDFGRQEGRGIAKAVIAQRVKGPEQTEAQRNFVYGQTNPDFARRELELKRASQPNTTIDMKGETAAVQARAKAGVEAEVEANKEARSAGQELQNLAGLQARLERLKTGPTAPLARSAAMWAQDLGVSPETLESFGIPKGFVGDANSFESATAAMLVGKIGSGGFPSANFSNADREFLERTLPRIATDPRGNRIMVETAKRVAASKIEKMNAYRQWRRDPANKDANFFDFDMDYTSKIGNRFDDLVGEARQMLDQAGAGFQPQATQPGQAPPQQNGGGAQIIQRAAQQVQQEMAAGKYDAATVAQRLTAALGPEKAAEIMQQLGIAPAQPQAAQAPRAPSQTGLPQDFRPRF